LKWNFKYVIRNSNLTKKPADQKVDKAFFLRVRPLEQNVVAEGTETQELTIGGPKDLLIPRAASRACGATSLYVSLVGAVAIVCWQS